VLEKARGEIFLMATGREPVVRAALKLLDEVGLEGLTLRRIAKALGVQAPTLYWRFKNKQDLIDEMATQVLADWAAEAEREREQTSWRERVLAFGRGLRMGLLRYRDGARMVAGSYLSDNALYGPMERTLQVFAAANIPAPEAAACLNTVYCYVIGFVIEEQATLTPKGERDPRYELSARDARLDPSLYPLTRSAGPAFFGNNEARLERGLEMIIAGFEAVRLAHKPLLPPGEGAA
jgi:TetR/AcrR family transcriptional regulator, tetracycline repressor protein